MVSYVFKCIARDLILYCYLVWDANCFELKAVQLEKIHGITVEAAVIVLKEVGYTHHSVFRMFAISYSREFRGA